MLMLNRIGLHIAAAIATITLVFSGAAVALTLVSALVLALIPTMIFFVSLAVIKYAENRL